jgi:hypothetical protein
MDTKPGPTALCPLCRQPVDNPGRFGSGPCRALFHGDGRVEGERVQPRIDKPPRK